MRRRDLMMLLGSATMAAPLVARAQQKPMPVIGILGVGSATGSVQEVGAFRQGLAETGYLDGQNVAIESHWAEGRYDRLALLVADFVSRKVDVIVTIGGTSPALAAKNATSTIPIVFADVGDPVFVGLAASLAHPGGNLTGVSNLNTGLTLKRLQLITELVSQPEVIAQLINPDNRNSDRILREAQDAARTNGWPLTILRAHTESEIDAQFATLAQFPASALSVQADAVFAARRDQLLALSMQGAVPTIWPWDDFVSKGGLISYGPDYAAALRQSGLYAGRILSGTKPADLPVQQSITFRMVINLKTAKALGLTIPPTILARADEVIE
jgi:ABC-type uncharacterized transport system substrate-binding protein